MPSGEFRSYPIDSITINRDARQRRELTGIEELAESFKRTGQIHPIVITREGVLVAGERRLTAAKLSGWTSINVQFADELDPKELHLIELEENIRRVDLTWQEKVAATQEYHNLRKSEDPEWDIKKTASAIGLKEDSIYDHLAVAAKLSDPKIAALPKLSTAKGIIQRDNARRKATILATIKDPPKVPLINADFTEWAAAYSGPKFNFLHCDFPYGINAQNQQQGNNTAQFTAYDDSPDVYFALLKTLERSMDNVVAESAHIMFWFSMRFYNETLEALTLAGWRVDPFPLVWHKSDNIGLLPDPKRGPRRIYETAFIGSRGDRLIVNAVSNTVSLPTTGEIHMSEKPVPVLRHFFRMFVDEHTLILDPTCGSGNAIRAAEQANFRLGIERDEEIFKLATERFHD